MISSRALRSSRGISTAPSTISYPGRTPPSRHLKPWPENSAYDRRNHRARPPAWDGRKRGLAVRRFGRSHGGQTSKIVALVDTPGNFTRSVLLPGQRHDSVGVAPLLNGVVIGALIGDKDFDNDWLRHECAARGALAVIPPKADRRTRIPRDFVMYGWRHLIGNYPPPCHGRRSLNPCEPWTAVICST